MKKNVCVYCGSNFGNRDIYRQIAQQLGAGLAELQLGMVYGGGSVGLMGTVADAVLAGGSEVIGVIPEKLVQWEKDHRGLTQLHVVNTMHERKKMMMDHADAFVVLPGGYGTLEELFEVLAWLQLGYHHKPVVILNVEGFFDPLLQMLDRMVEEGLLMIQHRHLLKQLLVVDEVLDYLRQYFAENSQ